MRGRAQSTSITSLSDKHARARTLPSAEPAVALSLMCDAVVRAGAGVTGRNRGELTGDSEQGEDEENEAEHFLIG